LGLQRLLSLFTACCVVGCAPIDDIDPSGVESSAAPLVALCTVASSSAAMYACGVKATPARETCASHTMSTALQRCNKTADCTTRTVVTDLARGTARVIGLNNSNANLASFGSWSLYCSACPGVAGLTVYTDDGLTNGSVYVTCCNGACFTHR
jgi:hypothetical protein